MFCEGTSANRLHYDSIICGLMLQHYFKFDYLRKLSFDRTRKALIRLGFPKIGRKIYNVGLSRLYRWFCSKTGMDVVKVL